MTKLALSALVLVFMVSVETMAIPITMLQNPSDSMQARVDFINRAKKSITAQFFAIDHDRISLGSLALLRNAAANGVQVRILVDSLNNKMTREMMAALLMNSQPLSKSNIEIREFNNFNLFHPTRLYKRMHDKSLIIDGKILVIGGRNIANGYFDIVSPDEDQRMFQDSDMVVFGGPATDQANIYFNDLWNSKNVSQPSLYEFERKNLASDACIGLTEKVPDCVSRREASLKLVAKSEATFDEIVDRIKSGKSELVSYDSGKDWISRSFESPTVEFLHDPVVGRKADKVGDGIAKKLYELIRDKAQKNVLIITPYFVLTPEQENLFSQLIERGVAVTIMTNSRKANDVPAAQAGYEMTRNRTASLGVQIFEYKGPETLHAKMVVIDQRYLFIGSFNWDYRSQNLNREVGIFTSIPDDESATFKQDLNEKLALILGNSTQYGARDNSFIEIGLRDFFKVDFKSKNLIVWRLIFPVFKRAL